MRWIAAPLVAVVLLGGSGFMDALERSTDASADLAALSREAPRTTAAAAREVGSLPDVARLTEQQAAALKALADALEVSADRIGELNATLTDQIASAGDLGTRLELIQPLLTCVSERTEGLSQRSRPVPNGIDSIASILSRIGNSQEKSIRHMRSINRKLTALGVVATASGVRPPPPPNISEEDLPSEEARPGAPC